MKLSSCSVARLTFGLLFTPAQYLKKIDDAAALAAKGKK
jgi:hypothetical protein